MMPIERKDRSFDLIFDQVTLDHVPVEYILEIVLELVSGETIIIEQEDLIAMEAKTGNAISSIMKDDIINISVKIDYDTVKEDVINGVEGFLGKYFEK